MTPREHLSRERDRLELAVAGAEGRWLAATHAPDPAKRAQSAAEVAIVELRAELTCVNGQLQRRTWRVIHWPPAGA